MTASKEQLIRYPVQAGIAEITLDRPPVNLIDREMTLQYHAALKRADTDDAVRVIVLNGAGKGLSGGVDIKYMESFDAPDMHAFLRLFYVDTIKICRALTKPCSISSMPAATD